MLKLAQEDQSKNVIRKSKSSVQVLMGANRMDQLDALMIGWSGEE